MFGLWQLIASNWLSALLPWGLSFVCATLATLAVMQFTRAKGLVAKPSSERWHKKPTALFGGVAIFAATMLTAPFFLPAHSAWIGLGIGATFIFAVGIYDDLRAMVPAKKFVAQLIAACIFMALYYGSNSSAEQPMSPWLFPLAIIWIVGITNSFNLLDNMDGLSAGIAAIASLLLAAQAAVSGNVAVAMACLVLAGASCGFLVFNFNPARIFMGDCGSMFLGFCLACLTLLGQSEILSGNLFTTLLLPTLVLATPIFDTLFVSLVRMMNGRKVSQGGRDHTSHRLVVLGLSERRAVCWLYGITLWFGLVGLWGYMTNNPLAGLAVTLLSAIGLLVLGVFLAEVQTYAQEEYNAARERKQKGGEKTVLSRVISHKRRFVEALLDFGLICACWIAAFLLRFDGNVTEYARTLSVTLPYVVACSMTAFYAFGLYQTLWQYVTTSDLRAAGLGVVGGGAAASLLIVMFAPIPAFPWSVLIIHSVLLLLSVIGVRVGLKMLRYHFAHQWRSGRKRVLVVGAGSAGELAVREMLHNQALQLQPVGFLDDNPDKRGARIHGVRVLGTRSELMQKIGEMNIDEVVIAMPSVGNGVVQELVDICGANGIETRQVRGVIL